MLISTKAITWRTEVILILLTDTVDTGKHRSSEENGRVGVLLITERRTRQAEITEGTDS